jgi:hypothetical protein
MGVLHMYTAGQTLSSTLQRRLITMVKIREPLPTDDNDQAAAAAAAGAPSGDGDSHEQSTDGGHAANGPAAAAVRMPAHHNLSAKVFRQAERAEDRYLKQQKTATTD